MSHDQQILAGHCTALPAPRVPIVVRPAVMSDLPFIDRLQKLHSKQVGWMPTRQLEGKIAAGHVIVAEENDKVTRGQGDKVKENLPPCHPVTPSPCHLLGYCIGHDQYFKRDDVGIIYQLNVAPGSQRKLVGAMLLKAQFDRSAYGCRLYCCWCAQDIEANRFWESMGFVPLAFRAGSEKKRRVHIFWCKRIRQGDTSTPWWFPSETKGGSMMEDRLVFPIPPGTHWSDAKPIVLPRHTQPRQIEDRSSTKKKPASTAILARRPLCGGLMFAPAVATVERPKREAKKKEKIRNDPKFVAAARELRDRWLEKVNEEPALLAAGGKYELSRALPGPVAAAVAPEGRRVGGQSNSLHLSSAA